MNNPAPQIWMFHFRCFLCGAEPDRLPLREYLHSWIQSSPQRLSVLLTLFSEALGEVKRQASRTLRPDSFRAGVTKVRELIGELDMPLPDIVGPQLESVSGSQMHFKRQCPACLTPAGARKVGNYFTTWQHACAVQVGNLLYEIGLVLWAILCSLPEWASGGILVDLSALRQAIRETGRSLSLLECPQCGRLTTCLYGYPDAEKTGFCRWC